MRLGFLRKFVNKKNNCFLRAVSGPNRGSILCSVLFNTKLTPSVKHRILALISPKPAVLTKRQHLVNPRNAATGNREIHPPKCCTSAGPTIFAPTPKYHVKNTWHRYVRPKSVVPPQKAIALAALHGVNP